MNTLKKLKRIKFLIHYYIKYNQILYLMISNMKKKIMKTLSFKVITNMKYEYIPFKIRLSQK